MSRDALCSELSTELNEVGVAEDESCEQPGGLGIVSCRPALWPVRCVWVVALIAATICAPVSAAPGEPVLELPLGEAQSRIEAAASQAQAGGDFAALDAVEAALREMPTAESGNLRYYRSYWLAYAKYRRAGGLAAAGRNDEIGPVLEQAMALLADIEPADSDSHALFGLVAGMNLGFVAPSAMFKQLDQISESLARALALDETNVRAWYANAMSDFNTPAEFGGGRRTERYLRKAIALEQKPSALGPTWGRRESIGLLLEFYLREERLAEAQELLRQATAEFPQSAFFASYAERMAASS